MMRQRVTRGGGGRKAAAGQLDLTAKVDGMNTTILHGCIRLIILFPDNAVDYILHNLLIGRLEDRQMQ